MYLRPAIIPLQPCLQKATYTVTLQVTFGQKALQALHSSDTLLAFLSSASSLKLDFLNVATRLERGVRSHCSLSPAPVETELEQEPCIWSPTQLHWLADNHL